MIPFVFITADDNYEKINKCISFGANKVITKPFQIENISNIIKDIFSEKFPYDYKFIENNDVIKGKTTSYNYLTESLINWDQFKDIKESILKTIQKDNFFEYYASKIELITIENYYHNKPLFKNKFHELKNIANILCMQELKTLLNLHKEIDQEQLEYIRKIYIKSISMISEELKK